MRVDLRLPIAVLLLALALPLKAQGLLSDYFLAVANDKVSDVRDYLKRGIDPNSVDANGDTGLITAARAGNAATVDVLLAARADPERRNRFGDTAMMVAALNGHFGIMKALRAKGAAVDGPGWTPLIYAATGGHEEIVRWLLGEGADVNATSPNGTTALMMAVRENRYSTSVLLIARGANVSHRNENGASALDWAKRGNDEAMVERLKRAGARD
ncbi:MAG: ankyrin repeat domain-containing protein [Betaproteobacteria bacterium]|nr:ankyrin repeat domain-containing protein [Betaproteobacteria bacterium]